MKRKLAICVILLIVSSILASCWSRRELNEIAIATAIGLDKKGDQYFVTAQVVNPSEVASSKKSAGGMGAPVAVYSESADSIFGALTMMSSKSPRKIYLAHLRVLVIGEELAQEGIIQILDFFSRDHEARADYPVMVARGMSAERILRTYTIPMEIIPANKIRKSLEGLERSYAGVVNVSLDKLISKINRKTTNPVLAGIRLIGKKESEKIESKANVESLKPIASLQIHGVAVFKADKLVGWLNEEESMGFDYSQGEVKTTVKAVSCLDSEGKLVLETTRMESKMKGRITNGRPQIYIQVSEEDNMAEVQCGIDIMKESTIRMVEQRQEKQIKEMMRTAIRKAQKQYRSDIFGFGEAIHRSDPKAWKRLKPKWDDEFTNVPVVLDVDVRIRRVGTITQPAGRVE